MRSSKAKLYASLCIFLGQINMYSILYLIIIESKALYFYEFILRIKAFEAKM